MKPTAYRAAALAAAFLAVGGMAAAEPYKIRVGHGAAVEEQLWLMKAMPAITPNQGKAYTLDYQLFRGTDQRFKAVEAGELDVFTSSGATSTIAFSQGLKFKAVATISMESNKGFVTQYVVLADSPIKSIADLKGKTLGNNSARSSIELWAQLALEKHGLNPDRDVQWAIIPFPSQGEALRAKKIDVAALPQPFAAAEMAKGGVRTLFTSKEGMPFDEELMLVLVTPDFAAKRPDVLRAFLADFVAATKFYVEKPKEARKALIDAKMVRVPEALYVNMSDNYRNPTARIDIEALKKAQEAAIAKGQQKNRVDPAAFVDLSFLPQ
ncbi:MAG: ABC transporter substrate-binding protein [Candidatus Odyssella sp.]|nr:ABC transporter substrate-binding protein [Candidatus Odyssella sp.]